MKFLIVFSVLSLCAINGHGFFLKNHPLLGGLLGGGSSSGASVGTVAAPPPPPPPPPPPAPAAPRSNPLAGLGQLISIPLGIKKSLLQSHQKKINQRFDQVIGLLDGFGSIGSSSAGAEIPIAPAVIESGFDGSSSGGLSASGGSGVDFSVSSGSEYASGSSSYTGSSSYNGASSYNAGGNVQSYQPQPAPNTAYTSNPVVLYLYPIAQSGGQAHVETNSVDYSAPAPIAPAPQPVYGPPAPDCNSAPAPPPIAPAPLPIAPPPAPIAQPQQVYGPPDFVPAPPISSISQSSSESFDIEPQVVQQVSNTYLPPNRKK